MKRRPSREDFTNGSRSHHISFACRQQCLNCSDGGCKGGPFLVLKQPCSSGKCLDGHLGLCVLLCPLEWTECDCQLHHTLSACWVAKISSLAGVFDEQSSHLTANPDPGCILSCTSREVFPLSLETHSSFLREFVCFISNPLNVKL